MKRTALVLTVGLLVLIGWASLATTQTRELVVAAWGDPYEAGWRKALVPAFEKQHGAKIVWVQGFSSRRWRSCGPRRTARRSTWP